MCNLWYFTIRNILIIIDTSAKYNLINCVVNMVIDQIERSNTTVSLRIIGRSRKISLFFLSKSNVLPAVPNNNTSIRTSI